MIIQSLLLTALLSGQANADSVAITPCDSSTLSSIREELLVMYEKDQKFRSGSYDDSELLAEDSVTVRDPWEIQIEIDQNNIARLVEMIERCGWPGIGKVGKRASGGAFLILQHAAYEFQKKLLPVFRLQAEQGEARKSDLALLEDRVLMREGKPQLYGSQVVTNPETGEKELYQVSDEINVDARRAAMGLGPLADYLAWFDIKYKPPTTKK